MKIKREEFLRALESVSPGVANKEIIEQSNCFVFRDGKVYSFNDEVSVSFPLDLGSIEGVVPAKELKDLLNRSNDEMLTISATGDVLKIKGVKYSAKLTIKSEIKLPIESVVIPDVWTKFPDHILLKFELCQLSVGRDMAKPVLTNIHWNGKIVESCDNYRVSRYVTDHDGPKDILIPGTSLSSLIKDYKPEEYSYTAEWLHFKTSNGCIYSIRLFEGTFPNLDGILVCLDEQPIDFPSELSDVLFRSEVLADPAAASPEAILTIKDNKIVVTSSSESGSFEEELDIKTDVEVEFRVYARLLQAIMKHLESAIIDMKSGKIRFNSSEGLTHIITVSKV